MKILVTGGSGYLGTHVRKYFEADDFSRRSNFDLLNLHDVQKADEYDVVIHLAALLDKSRDADEEVFLNNVEGTINLLKSIREDTAFIFASTKDVYGRFADNYDEVPESCQTIYSGQSALEWSKLIAEKYIAYYARRNNFRSCIFRLSTVYAPKSDGNASNFVTSYTEKVTSQTPIKLPASGRPVRDLLHVDDFSKACEAFFESIIRHGIYNLGGGKGNSISLGNLVTKIGEITEAEPVIDEHSLPAPAPINYISDLSLVKTELDWKPRISIDEGISTLIK